MKVSLLGPLEVWVGQKPLRLQRPRQRALLAVLAVHANKPVATDSIAEMVWGLDAPRKVRNQIQVHVSNIRKALRPGGADDLLETHPSGYVLRLHPAATDLSMFTALESVGQAAYDEGRFRAASEAYRLALRTWRGPALAGIDAAFVPHEAQLLEERRQSVFRHWVDIEIGTGRLHHLVPSLYALHRENPLDEGICLRLMAVLQRSGRSSEALEVFGASKRLLSRELGIDPDESLQAAQVAILRSEYIEHPDWQLQETVDQVG